MNTKKSLSIATMLVAMVLIGSGCHHRMSGVKGSGVRQTEKRDLPSFTSIATEGAFDIEVVSQKDQSLEITGDDNILPLITTEVSNNVLRIRSRSNYSVDENIVVKITVPNLERVEASGAGEIKITNLKNEKFSVEVNGAPTITAAGETKLLQIETNGAAKIHTQKLRAAVAEVESNGVSEVELYASDKLDVTISGPSEVTYEGDPDVNQTINGPGKLQKRESEGV